MADDRLLQQVASDIAAGLSEEQIRQKHGGREWTTEDINGAMAIVRLRDYSPTVAAHDLMESERAPKKRDVLSEILLLIVIFGGVPMAYILATHVGAPLFDQFLTAIVAKQEGIPMPTETADTNPPATAQTSNSFPAASAPAPVASTPAPAATPATTKPAATPPATAAPASTPAQPVASLPVPTATLSADSTTVTAGSSVTLSWTSTNATTCVGDSFPTASRASGSTVVKVYGSYDFSITCKNASHSVSRSVHVAVQ